MLRKLQKKKNKKQKTKKKQEKDIYYNNECVNSLNRSLVEEYSLIPPTTLMKISIKMKVIIEKYV